MALQDYLRISLDCYAALRQDYCALEADLFAGKAAVPELCAFGARLESAFPDVCVIEHRLDMRSMSSMLQAYGKVFDHDLPFIDCSAGSLDRFTSIGAVPREYLH